MSNTVQKLRIYAMLMRLQEIERELLMSQFLPKPLKIVLAEELMPEPISLYDKKGQPLPSPKSKYHK